MLCRHTQKTYTPYMCMYKYICLCVHNHSAGSPSSQNAKSFVFGCTYGCHFRALTWKTHTQSCAYLRSHCLESANGCNGVIVLATHQPQPATISPCGHVSRHSPCLGAAARFRQAVIISSAQLRRVISAAVSPRRGSAREGMAVKGSSYLLQCG